MLIYEIFRRFFKASDIKDTFKCAFCPGTQYIIVGLIRGIQEINIQEIVLNPEASVKMVIPLSLLDMMQVEEIDL